MEAVVASFTQMEQITAALEKAVEFKENKLERALEQFGARFEALETLWETSFGSRSSTARSARSGGLARAATMETRGFPFFAVDTHICADAAIQRAVR